MTWLRVKKWLAFMKRKRKRHNIDKNCPVIESKGEVTETMSTLGRSCERLPTQYVKNCGHIPVVLTNAAFVIEKNLKTKGLFQTQGSVSKVNACLNQLLAPRLSTIKHENVHDVIEAMKTFLVRLPEPLMPESVCDALISRSPETDSTSQYVAVLTKFRNSSPYSFAILQFMMLLLKRISEYSEYNTMDVRKLATVFVLDIIKPLKLEDSHEGLFLIERMQRLPYLIMVVENIIKQVDIFQTINSAADSRSSQAGSPMLVERSNNGLPHTGLRSNSSETHGLTNPTTDGNEDTIAAGTSQIDEVGEFHSNQIRDLRNQYNERSLMKPPEQVARALSEPRQETAHTADVCKRCVTALPVCASGIASEIAGFTDVAARDPSSMNLTVLENGVNPIEVSLEPVMETRCAVLGTAVDVAQRKIDVSRTATLGGKKCTSRGATCSPVRRKSTKKDQDDPSHNTWEVKPHKSMDINAPAAQNKRKRKCRSTSKKPKPELDRSLAESSGRGSDFTTFQPDEEITPWNEGSTNSDDTSVMVKTIRNPRVLAHAASTPIKFENQVEGENVNKLKERIISSDKVSRMFLANYGFRTISSQNNFPTTPGSSQTTSSSDTSFCANICPTPDVFGHSSSNNTTPISKELIRGIKLKGSIGVNTSPCLEFYNAEAKSDDFQRAHDKHKDAPKVKTPITGTKEIKANPRSSTAKISKLIPPTPVKNTSHAPTITESGARLRLPANGMPSFINNPQYHHPRLPLSSQLTISGRSDRCSSSSHIKLRHQQLRRALRSSSSSLEQKTRRNSTNDACTPSLFLKEWFVDTILAFITVLCISLIFLVYEHDKSRGSWLK